MSLQPPERYQSMSAYDEAAKTHALIAYGLMVAGLFTGILWVVGLVWAMLKKEDARDSIFYDHYQNIISTFLWSLGLWVVGSILVWVFFGWFILLGVWVWAIYRLLKGLARITANQSFRD
ncbi:MAG: hypothetical protein HRU23_05005 [Gammaproteobacteria bacterium]|nr:hypothetical protein [Gammaproteobacteria bacterium]